MIKGIIVKIRRYVAKDMRTALAQIKEELGADAVIMSNKKIAEGVELMAAVDYSQVTPDARPSISKNESITPPHKLIDRDVVNDVVSLGKSEINKNRVENIQPNFPVDSLSALLNRDVQKTKIHDEQYTGQSVASDEESIEQKFKNFTERLESSNGNDIQSVQSDGQSFISPQVSFSSTEENRLKEQLKNANTPITSQKVVDMEDFAKMQKEMASIRQLLEHQVSGLMWQDMAQKDPRRALLVNRLTDLGLTEQIADQIAGYVPEHINENDSWQHALQLISQQVNTTNNDIINRGGVVALVGPTGVGKTTTIAKLAARFSQLHGADQVALISTDTFRIAGFEQLSTYGRIIGCQVKLAQDAESLDVLLQQFSKKKLILIDTAGMGQRDMRLAEHLSNLITNSRVKIRNYLVLSANTQQRVMQENVERFKKVPLSGCIYTKLDESVSIGEIITTSIQNGLPIGYLTDGQRVPEDIKVANAEKLVTLADKMISKLNAQSPVRLPTASLS